MHWFRAGLACSLSLLLQAAGQITASPALPFPGRPVTLVLTATPDPFGPVQWSFGDGTIQDGGTVTTTTYASPGSYMVRARYRTLTAGGTLSAPQVAQAQLRVAEHPAAPFGVAMLRLRWADGGVDAAVPQGFSPLVAYLDLKCQGTGQLLAQWLVDGIAVGTLTRQVAFASTLTLDSRDLPSLPTMELGEHQVTLRFLSPSVTFEVPTIRYFVRVARGEPPRVEAVTPSVLHVGTEAELQISGTGFTEDLRLSFGKDIAVVTPLRVLSPTQAVARVYLAPGARIGLRKVGAVNRFGSGRGPGGIRVLPPGIP